MHTSLRSIVLVSKIQNVPRIILAKARTYLDNAGKIGKREYNVGSTCNLPRRVRRNIRVSQKQYTKTYASFVENLLNQGYRLDRCLCCSVSPPTSVLVVLFFGH